MNFWVLFAKGSRNKTEGANVKLCVLSTLLWDNPITPFTLVKKNLLCWFSSEML